MRPFVLALVLATACGRTVPHGGEPKQPADKPRVTTVTTASDLIPADLDLVVRVDLAKVRSDLGPEASAELVTGALDSAKVSAVARETLAEAEVIWLGLRIADLDSGDHVMVATRKRKRAADGQPQKLIEPATKSWTKSGTSVPSISRFVRTSPSRRADTARIFTVADTAAVFVSPVEEYSVERLLRMGPDPSRGEPTARGLLSLDLRAPRLSRTMSKKYPALTKLVRSVTRVRAAVDLFGDALELEGTIRCDSPAAAKRVKQYLATYTMPQTRFAELLAGVKLEQAGASVLLRWRVPRSLLFDTANKQVKPPTP